MKTFSIKEAIRVGWELFKKDKANLIIIAFAFSVFSNVSNLDRILPEMPLALSIVGGSVLFILAFIIQIGWFKTLFKVLDGGKAEFGELFEHGRLFFKYLGAFLMFGLRVGIPATIGALVCIFLLGVNWLLFGVAIIATVVITGYLALKYSFALLLIIDREEVGISQSFKVSSQMTEGIKLKLLGLNIVSGLLTILGLVALIIGYLVALPVTTLASLSVYRKFLPPEMKETNLVA